MTETILQTRGGFQIIRYILNRESGPLDVTIANHTSCAQPEFRRRLQRIVDNGDISDSNTTSGGDTRHDLYRVEEVDPGGQGDRIGLRVGDILLVLNERGRWELGVPSDLQRRNEKSINENDKNNAIIVHGDAENDDDDDVGERYTLHVLRDVSSTNHASAAAAAAAAAARRASNNNNDFENMAMDLEHDDYICSLAEEETTKEKTEDSGGEDEESSSQKSRGLPPPPPPPRPRAERTTKIMETKSTAKKPKGLPTIPGYELLGLTVDDHFKKPFGGELVIDNNVSSEFRKATQSFFDDKPDQLLRFRRVTIKGIAYRVGVRENDIFVLNYKGFWYIGDPGTLNTRLHRTRPFRLCVLRKRDGEEGLSSQSRPVLSRPIPQRVRPRPVSQPPAAAAVDISSPPDAGGRVLRKRKMPSEEIAFEESKINASPRGKVPSVKRYTPTGTDDDTDDVCKVPTPEGMRGYDIIRCHIRFRSKTVKSFDAQLIEEESPSEFLKSACVFFEGETANRCRFTNIKKNKFGDMIGIKENDILLKRLNNDWYLGTVEDFQHRCKKNRPFFLYLLRNSRKGTPPAVGKTGGSRRVPSDYDGSDDSDWGRSSDGKQRSSRQKCRLIRGGSRAQGNATGHEAPSKTRPTNCSEQTRYDSQRLICMGTTESMQIDDIKHYIARGRSCLAVDDESERRPFRQAADFAATRATQSNKRLYSDSFSSAESSPCSDKEEDKVDVEDIIIQRHDTTSSAGMSSSTSSMGEWDILELLQELGGSPCATTCSSIVDSIAICLESSKEVEKLVSVAGRCHMLALWDHPSERIRAIGWKVARVTHKFFPHCRESLVESGFYTKIIHSLQTCQTTALFEAVVDVLVSSLFGTDVDINEFASIDGAIPSLIMAIDRQLGASSVSYISCCRFMASALASRRNKVAI